MFTLLDYDVSRYLFHTLAPRLHRIMSGGYKPLARNTCHLNDPDLHPRPHFTLTSSRSAQEHQRVRMTPVSVHRSWSCSLNSSPGLLKRSASGHSGKEPPSGHGGRSAPAAGGLPFKDNPATVEAFRNARKFEDIPGPTAPYQTVPFAGTRLLYYPFADETLENMGGMLSKLQSCYGPIMRVRLGYQWVVFIEHLGDIQHAVKACEKELSTSSSVGGGGVGGGQDSSILSFPSPQPRPVTPLDRLLHPAKDPALIWLDAGAKPQRQRDAVGRHLGTATSLRMYLCFQEQIAQDLLRQLERCMHSPQDLQTLFRRYALENSGQLCFSHRLGLLGDHYLSDGQKQRVVESYHTVIGCLGEILTGTRLFYTLFKDPFGKRFREARAFVQNWERHQMREVTMAALREKGVQTVVPEECGLLVSLLDDKSLTEEIISDILHALMATRSEATPIEVNSRRTARSLVWFDHPAFYMPERWLGEKSDKIPAMAFMPFGFIDHGCLGLRSFFFQELSAATIKILQNYKIDLPEDYHNGQMQTVHTPFCTPKEPLPFIFSPREPLHRTK